MKNIRAYKILFRVAIIGSILSFGRCATMAFYSIGTSMGGHGEQAVIDAKRDGNEAELFFFLSMALLMVAVVLLYIINKALAKNSEAVN